jgi:hypothetical protein
MRNRSAITGVVASCSLAAAVVVTGGGMAMAHDHLADAATSTSVDDRGFANPVAGNPSGVSGAAAQPGTVPGLGNPNGGRESGTLAFDCSVLELGLAARSSGMGPSCE